MTLPVAGPLADDIVFLSGNYMELQGLLEAINRHSAAFGMRIGSSLLSKYPDSMFVQHCQGVEETRSRVNFARSAFSHLQSCL